MTTPDKASIRSDATRRFMMSQARFFDCENLPEDSELREEGLTEDAKLTLMQNAVADEVEQSERAIEDNARLQDKVKRLTEKVKELEQPRIQTYAPAKQDTAQAKRKQDIPVVTDADIAAYKMPEFKQPEDLGRRVEPRKTWTVVYRHNGVINQVGFYAPWAAGNFAVACARQGFVVLGVVRGVEHRKGWREMFSLYAKPYIHKDTSKDMLVR